MQSVNVKPVVAVTMGDPSGIGPEIVLKTLMTPMIYEVCKPFIIGNADILAKSAGILNQSPVFHKIKSPREALYTFGTIDVLDPGNYDTSGIVFSSVQAKAGMMAFDYVKKSIELGLAGEIDAVSTAPINKAALRAAKINFIGHTEIYAELTKAPYALTMFNVHKLRVFFVSRHLSLRDAIAYANKGNVLRFIRNIDTEFKKLGFEKPKIAVAAINPHGGEGGMFGTEEITDLIPADSVFHLGAQGRYDCILSMYHDQGHIACKTLDFDKSVTLTLGLPFMRSSVDHGTAFDIAGKGIANAASMIESTRVVAEYSKMAIARQESGK
ncbi:MAG: 4-hydroxythreonine-4-phosphate dehydrogenase PdxA [Oscillospiraceae bacterium]|nr:4-hydroxythreonine-4-phosphate dehydrogenase PdxA [Oscillospiraceae bacterium]